MLLMHMHGLGSDIEANVGCQKMHPASSLLQPNLH